MLFDDGKPASLLIAMDTAADAYQQTGLLVLVSVYFMCLLLLSLFSAHRYVMLHLYYSKRPRNPLPEKPPGELPLVTIQLPVYNERYVVERLLEAVSRVDYPPGKLQVQVLDDSTDETCSLAESCVRRLADRGLNIEYIHREDRSGYKAGALRNGLKSATGEFVAIFDADFIPAPDFLRRVLPHFSDPGIGMVQMRWEHINRRFSFLTELQSIMLDGHFVIEHSARHYSGRFFNFNGTAGVWRRSAVESAGGWQHDTLTEDLDLSYRAQLCGWRFVYLPGVTSAAELPVDMNAFKTQQHRWTKGSIQTALKLLPVIWKSSFSLPVKIEASFHLMNNLAYLFLVVVAVLMFPVLLAREAMEVAVPLWLDLGIFFAATVSIVSFYIASQREILPQWKRQLPYIPFMMGLGIGLCVNNAKAVVEALLGVKTEFVRTPKFGLEKGGEKWWSNRYLSKASAVAFVETGLALYYAAIVWHCIENRNFYSLPFMLLFLFGFSYVGFLSLSSLFRRQPELTPVEA